MNLKAVDNTLAHLHEVPVPQSASTAPADSCRRDHARRARSSSAMSSARSPPVEGDELPVSAFPCDGTFPTATAQYEKRNLALEIPVWDEKRLHSVREMRRHLSARHHPRQSL